MGRTINKSRGLYTIDLRLLSVLCIVFGCKSSNFNKACDCANFVGFFFTRVFSCERCKRDTLRSVLKVSFCT
jgi:hypothetical protein